MAYIYKGAEDPRLHDPRYSLSYEELAQLHRAAKSGNSAAAVRLAQLPPTERRLAGQVDKAFTGKSGKPGTKKSGKSRCILCGRKQCQCAGPGLQQQPSIAKAAAVASSIKKDFLRNRHDPEACWDPGKDAILQQVIGPTELLGYAIARIAEDPIRKRCASKYGISAADLVAGGEE